LTSIFALSLALGWAFPAAAKASSGASAYSHPAWWQKFETVSAPGFKPVPLQN